MASNRIVVKGNGVTPDMDARAYAHKCAGDGVAFLADAFNACDSDKLPYRYDSPTRERFLELIIQIRDLVDAGKIIDQRGVLARAD